MKQDMKLPLEDETMPLTFHPHEWVELFGAFNRIRSITPSDVALACLNRDLRSERLGSALVEILPDGKVTMTPLNSSHWQQRTVHAPFERTGLRVGYRFEVKPPFVAGHCFVRRADLDKCYPDPATPTMPAVAEQVPAKAQPVGPPQSQQTEPAPKRKVEPYKTGGDGQLAKDLLDRHKGSVKLARRAFLRIVCNRDGIEQKRARARFKAGLEKPKSPTEKT